MIEEIETKAKEVITTNLRGIIDDTAWAQLMGFVTNVGNKEASGFFLYQRPEENVVHIKRAFLIKGTATSSYTEMDQKAKSKFMYQLFKHGILRPGTGWYLSYYHFHTSFNPFMSGTDRTMLDEISANTDFYPTIVMNNKGEYVMPVNIKIGKIHANIDTIPLELNVTGKKIHARDYKSECDRKIDSPAYIQSNFVYGHEIQSSGWWDWSGNDLDMPSATINPPQESSQLDRILWKLENGIPLMWFEQEIMDEETERAWNCLPLEEKENHFPPVNSKYDSVEAATGFFNYAGSIFKRGK